MKIKQADENSAKIHLVDLTLPDSFAELGFVLPGLFRYTFSYQINPTKASRVGVNLVQIHVYKEQPNKQPVPVFKTLTATDKGKQQSINLVDQVLKRTDAYKQAIQENNSRKVLTVHSDFTARIPNDKTNELQLLDSSKEVLFKQTKLRTVSTDTVSFLSPQLQPTPSQSFGTSKQFFKEASLDLLLKQHKDPASEIIRQQHHSVATVDTIAGVLRATQTQPSGLSKTFLENNNISSTTFSGGLVGLPTTIETPMIDVSEVVDIPSEIIGNNDFYVVYEVTDSSGLTIDTMTSLVQHSKLVDVLQTPTDPPLINHLLTGRTVTLTIRRTETVTVGVAVFKKQFTTTTESISIANYVFVGNAMFRNSTDITRFDDASNNNMSGLLVYRIVPFGATGVYGAEFGSAVVAMNTKVPTATTSILNQSFVVLQHEPTDNGLSVRVSKVSPKIKTISLKRKDLTSYHIGREVYVDKPLQLGQGQTSVEFLDSRLTKNKTYEYFVVLMDKHGNETLGSNRLVIEYSPETTKVINTVVVDFKGIIQSNNGADAKVSLKTDFVSSQEEQIRRGLERLGILSFFDGAISKENLQEQVGYSIVRTNLTTGETEDLGVTTKTTFLDSELSSVGNAKPIEVGFDYVYTITSHLRTNATLLKGYTKQVVDEQLTSKNYSFSPWKWQHPVTLTKGNIVTEQSLKQNHSKTQFSFGSVGNVVQASVMLSSMLPQIASVKAIKQTNRHIRVRWSVQGNMAKIDHFVILSEVNGLRSIRGKSHCLITSNQLEFIDRVPEETKGEIAWSVIPVYYDYSVGKEVRTAIRTMVN